MNESDAVALIVGGGRLLSWKKISTKKDRSVTVTAPNVFFPLTKKYVYFDSLTFDKRQAELFVSRMVEIAENASKEWKEIENKLPNMGVRKSEKARQEMYNLGKLQKEAWVLAGHFCQMDERFDYFIAAIKHVIRDTVTDRFDWHSVRILSLAALKWKPSEEYRAKLQEYFELSKQEEQQRQRDYDNTKESVQRMFILRSGYQIDGKWIRWRDMSPEQQQKIQALAAAGKAPPWCMSVPEDVGKEFTEEEKDYIYDRKSSKASTSDSSE